MKLDEPTKYDFNMKNFHRMKYFTMKLNAVKISVTFKKGQK